MKKFGLFVGIDRYKKLHPSARLECAGLDALALEKVFYEQLGFTTKVLLDGDLGYEGPGSQDVIFEQLDVWRAELASNDEALLLLYFAGHGVTTLKGKQFLLTPKAPDYALEDPEASTMGIISEDMLLNHTKDWPKTKRVLILDACRTVLNRQEAAVGLAARAIAGGPLGLLSEPNYAVLRACPPNQVAFELRNFGEEKKNHGLYTAALLAVIGQRAKAEKAFVLDNDLNREIAAEMASLATRYPRPEHQALAQQQRPVWEGEAICLVADADFAALKIGRLLKEFEAHFAAGRFYRPTVESCNNVILQLQSLNYLPETVLVLGKRMDAAEQAAQAQAKAEERMQRGERLMASARLMKTLPAFLRVREEGFIEYEPEIAKEIALLQGAPLPMKPKTMPNSALGTVTPQNIKQRGLVKGFLIGFGIVLGLIGLFSLIVSLGKGERSQSALEAFGPLESQPMEAAPAPSYAVGQTFRHPLKDGGEGPAMVVVPTGSYWMGAAAGEADAANDEKPQHQVTIAENFAIGKYEVTKGEFARFVQASAYKTDAEKEWGCYFFNAKENKVELRAGASWRAPPFDGNFKQDDTHPVVCVSWNDAKAYAAWLSTQTGKAYGLPSEAEWEYAARGEKAGLQASKTTPWPREGNDKAMCAYANARDESLNRIAPGYLFAACDDGYEFTAPVGKKLVNAFGLYDMHGNANEWVEDCYHDNYNTAPNDGSVWAKDCKEGAARVLRGGGWVGIAQGVRSAYRFHLQPDWQFGDTGFRLALRFPSPAGQ